LLLLREMALTVLDRASTWGSAEIPSWITR